MRHGQPGPTTVPLASSAVAYLEISLGNVQCADLRADGEGGRVLVEAFGSVLIRNVRVARSI